MKLLNNNNKEIHAVMALLLLTILLQFMICEMVKEYYEVSEFDVI